MSACDNITITPFASMTAKPNSSPARYLLVVTEKYGPTPEVSSTSPREVFWGLRSPGGGIKSGMAHCLNVNPSRKREETMPASASTVNRSFRSVQEKEATARAISLRL